MIMKEAEQNHMSLKVGERNVVVFCFKVIVMTIFFVGWIDVWSFHFGGV